MKRSGEPVNGCQHTFEELVQEDLPQLYRRLKSALRYPHSARLFVDHSSDRNTLRSKLKFAGKGDFSGCYVFADDSGPVYVGISRGVIGRLCRHLNSDPSAASLALKIARRGRRSKMSRNKEKWSDSEHRAFKSSQRHLRSCRVSFVEIDDTVTMYLFEVYAAMKLGTGRWNTLRTH
jgi:hypothetical protein